MTTLAPTIEAPAPVTTGAQLLPWLAGVARELFAEAQAAGDAAYAAEPDPARKSAAYHQGYILAARKAGLAPVCHCDFCAATKAAVPA